MMFLLRSVQSATLKVLLDTIQMLELYSKARDSIEQIVEDSVEKINNVDEWMSIGIKNGWMSDITCYIHDSVPMTDREARQFDEGFDFCIPIIRISE